MLSISNVSIASNQRWLCQNLTFQINPGECWGILGANGCGKTSLLKTMVGLHPPKKGEIFLQARPLNTLSAKQIAQQIALLTQETLTSFPQTVWEYCLASRYPHLPYFARETTRDLHIATEALQAMDLFSQKDKSIHHLSGGEKRRLAIAAVLTQTPHIYALDEPTNHLDIKYQIQVLQVMSQKTKQGASVIMVLHDINHAQQFCDHVLLFFSDGSIHHGSTRKLFTEENLSAVYGYPITNRLHDHQLFWRPSYAKE